MTQQFTEQTEPSTQEDAIASPAAIVERYERRMVDEHPFFRRLRSRPVDLSALWLLMANLREGISGHFVRWLARTIERAQDPRIASFMAKQLNDELGNGDPAQVHSVLLDRFIEGLRPWRPKTAVDASLAPGRRLAERGARPFYAEDPNEGLGALVVGEIFAKKMDRCLGDEIRRQDRVDKQALLWLEIHEVLEVDHADEVAELARLIPTSRSATAAAWKGAVTQWEALWLFLQEIDGVLATLDPDAR